MYNTCKRTCICNESTKSDEIQICYGISLPISKKTIQVTGINNVNVCITGRQIGTCCQAESFTKQFGI